MANDRLRKKDSARLVWDTKPRRAPNPKDIEFQTAEIVVPNPHRDEAQIYFSFKDGIIGETEIDKEKMNRLIWGDNLLTVQALLTQVYEGKINLIYIDPPFDSKADYSHKMTIEGNEFTKEPSVIERLAYKDTWAGGTDSYLDMLYPRLQLMKRLLAEDGSIYVHCDWHAGHYIKIIMDEVFGYGNFLNELIVHYTAVGLKAKSRKFHQNTESILFYAKNREVHIWNEILEPIKDPSKYRKASKHIWNPELGKAERLRDEAGRIQYFEVTEYKPDNFIEVPALRGDAKIDYDTQKHDDILERIIKTSSNEGDLVADFFIGSGTTLAVAERLGRRWLGCELGKVGIQMTRARLVEMGSKPFLIENIGNYQREMIYLTGGRIWEMQVLILKLYGATPRDNTSGLGVRKSDDGVEELVYVGYPDRPITAEKVEELAIHAQKLDGRGYKRLVILGWDYEYNYQSSLEQRLKIEEEKITKRNGYSCPERRKNIEIISRDIPPDIYDYLKKARSEEDIEALSDKVRFYERPYLRIDKPVIKEVDNNKIQVNLGIKRYVLMDIPVSHSTKADDDTYQSLMKLAKDNFAVLIDYWAIDWNYDGYTFKSQWQAFRGNGKKAKTVPLIAQETLDKKAKRNIAVRVVDIFGNDATATIELEG